MAQPYVFLQDQVGPPGRYVTLIGVFPGTPVIRIQRVDGTPPTAEGGLIPAYPTVRPRPGARHTETGTGSPR